MCWWKLAVEETWAAAVLLPGSRSSAVASARSDANNQSKWNRSKKKCFQRLRRPTRLPMARAIELWQSEPVLASTLDAAPADLSPARQTVKNPCGGGGGALRNYYIADVLSYAVRFPRLRYSSAGVLPVCSLFSGYRPEVLR